MNINRNPVQAADAIVIAEMRAANAENKRKVIGPEARSDSDAILSAEPPAPEGVRYERGVLAGVPDRESGSRRRLAQRDRRFPSGLSVGDARHGISEVVAV
jgi:hypothetical protein